MKRATKGSAFLSSPYFLIKTGIFIALFYGSLNLNGQNHYVGLKGGLDWTNNAFYNLSEKSHFEPGFSGGLTYEYLIHNNFSIGAQFIYEQRGFSNAMTFINPNGMPIRNTTHFNYDVLSVPLLAVINTGKKAYLFANVGLCPALVQNAKKTISTFAENGELIVRENYDVTTSMQKFDLSGLIEIGSGYQFANRCRLYASLGYQKSFITLNNSDYHSNDLASLHQGYYLSMGAQYALAKLDHKIAETSSFTNDYLLHKSKKQKNKAMAILVSGLGIAAVGGLVQLNHQNKSNGWDLDFTGAWIAIAGGGVSLISVPFFISSAVNARKSKLGSLTQLQINLQQQVGVNQSVNPALALHIKL